MKKLLSGVLVGVFFLMVSPFSLMSEEVVRPGRTEWDHGILFWKSDDGEFSGRFDTRAFLNGAYFFENKNELSNGTHLRKARLAIKMRLWKYWKVEWDVDVAEGMVETKDMFVSYEKSGNSYIKLGHFKMPFGLETLTSSRYIAFPERAYLSLAFKLNRRMALEYARWGRIWNIRTAIYGQTFDTNKNKTKDETGVDIGGRIAITPVQRGRMIIHAGFSENLTRPDDETDIVVFKSEPETKIGDVEILDTGPVKDVDYTNRIGLEGAFVYKNFHLQGEYAVVRVYRLNSLPAVNLGGGYVYLLWTITGESRQWDATQGEFGQLIPKDNYKGAWELGFRYSYLNLSDTSAGVLGGRANNFTVGLNWYANTNIVFQLNYTYVMNSENATGDGFVGGDQFGYVQFLTKFFF